MRALLSTRICGGQRQLVVFWGNNRTGRHMRVFGQDRAKAEAFRRSMRDAPDDAAFRAKYVKRPDLAGQKVGRWLVVGKSDNRYQGGSSRERMYRCRCECGTEADVRPASLHNGDSMSCGCLRREVVRADMYLGQRFGRLAVLERTRDRHKGSRAYLYRCRCDCGKEVLRPMGPLGSKTNSCGCLRGVRLPPGRAGFNLLMHEYRTGARARGYVFDLTDEQFAQLTSGDCFYCGAVPSRRKSYKNATQHSAYTFNGVDRVDNAVGYVAENCVSCCSRCNVAKATSTQAEFLEICRAVAARHADKEVAWSSAS